MLLHLWVKSWMLYKLHITVQYYFWVVIDGWITTNILSLWRWLTVDYVRLHLFTFVLCPVLWLSPKSWKTIKLLRVYQWNGHFISDAALLRLLHEWTQSSNIINLLSWLTEIRLYFKQMFHLEQNNLLQEQCWVQYFITQPWHFQKKTAIWLINKPNLSYVVEIWFFFICFFLDVYFISFISVDDHMSICEMSKGKDWFLCSHSLQSHWVKLASLSEHMPTAWLRVCHGNP